MAERPQILQDAFLNQVRKEKKEMEKSAPFREMQKKSVDSSICPTFITIFSFELPSSGQK